MKRNPPHPLPNLDRPAPDDDVDTFGMPPRLSRRDFLKFSALSAVPLLVPPSRSRGALDFGSRLPDFPRAPLPAPLGRLTQWWRQPVRQGPSTGEGVVRWTTRDDVIPLYEAVQGDPPWPTNPVWYRTEGGYIHSGYVQPVRDEQQPAVTQIAEPGLWVQVTRPWAEARATPASAYVAHRLYYGTTYRAITAVTDEEGQVWYQLKEGVSPWRPGPYALGSSFRVVTPEELTPISPGHPDKLLKIDRGAQTLSCLEGDSVVFHTRVSTGNPNTPTPLGEFRVLYKRHARRMTVTDIPSPYDLPGVAFPTYFTWSGVAIHGTYWHNDYGRVHSSGCINVTAEDAQWIFRWVEPVAPYEVYTQRAEPAITGTRVLVV